MLEKRKNKSNAEIRDDYPQSSLDYPIGIHAGRDLLALVSEQIIHLVSINTTSSSSVLELSFF
jgi:hypothetical protein